MDTEIDVAAKAFKQVLKQNIIDSSELLIAAGKVDEAVFMAKQGNDPNPADTGKEN